jgi:catabolite repression protein CreC
MSSRYHRLNKQGCISNSPCTAVRWVPTSTTLFLASHADGTIIIYDKEREDGVFTPQDPKSPSLSSAPTSGSPPTPQSVSSPTEWNALDNMFVTVPPWHPVTGGLGNGGRLDKEKTAKNPVSHWRVSRRSVVGQCHVPSKPKLQCQPIRQTLYSAPTSSTSPLFRKTGA